MPDNSIQTRPRVLIVDNEERAVNLYKRLLNIWQYTAVVAEGNGRDLLEDAEMKAKNSRCQIALVDMRLVDNFDEDDVSGLELIEKIKPASTIIVSAFGTLQKALEIVQNRGAADFFEKSEHPDVLKAKLERLAKKICAAGRTIRIFPPEILETTAQTLFNPDLSATYHDQIYDALAQLFPEARSLRLEKMNATTISSDFSTVPRPRSVILRVYEDDLQPVIVKLARRAKIKIEIEKFNKYIKGRLVGKYNPSLDGYADLWDIGGIKLSNVGTVEETFANFVSFQSIGKIEQSLEHFFAYTWSEHYSRAWDASNTSLFSLYCDVWGREWVRRATDYVMPTPSDAMDEALWEKAKTDNPLAWLKIMEENKGNQNDPSLVKETRIAITHGDLHGDNLLIDDSQHGWVVDFERTGEGHALQDFVELESDIITRIVCNREEFPAFYHFCVTVASGGLIGDIQPAHPALLYGETQKFLDTIAVIRRLAVQCTKITDARQYLLGLYFNTIFRATIISREQHRKSELRAWMLASILCHRLAHWDDPWPPEEWKNL